MLFDVFDGIIIGRGRVYFLFFFVIFGIFKVFFFFKGVVKFRGRRFKIIVL